MQENLRKDNNTTLAADEVSIKKMIQKFGDSRRYLLSRWKFLCVAAIIGGAIGFCYAKFKKTNYTAECTFVLEENDKGGGGLGQYSSLAAMAGFDVTGSSGLFQGDNITQLYKSRLMLGKTLFSSAKFNGRDELLIDRYIKINKFREAWANNANLKDISFDIPPDKFTVKHDSIINLIVADINKNYLTVEKPDKKLSMISVRVKSTDPLFSKAFTENIVANVNSFYIQTKTKGALQNVLLLQHQADSVHRVLNSSIGSSASAIDAIPNPDPTIQSLKVPSEKRQVEVQSSAAIYAEVTRNLEIARASLQREIPLIQVIDQPVLPLPNDRVGKLKTMVTGVFIAILIAALWLFTGRIYKGIMS